MMSEAFVNQILSDIVVPCIFIMFLLLLLLCVVCFLLKKADEHDKYLVLEKKRKEKELENRLSNLELKLEHVEVKPVGSNKFIS
jgi:hypothetical protein